MMPISKNVILFISVVIFKLYIFIIAAFFVEESLDIHDAKLLHVWKIAIG